MDFFTETVKTSSRKSSISKFLTNSSKPSDPYAMVHIVVVQAKELVSSASAINPFCKVSLGSGERRTKIIPGSFSPQWRQGFDIAWFKGQDDFIELFIHDAKSGTVESCQIGR